MADDDKDLDLDVVEEDKPKSKLMLIIIVVVVLLGGGAGAFFFLTAGGEEGEEGEESAEEVRKQAIYMPMKPPFVINYTVGSRQRYAQINVSLMARDDFIIEALQRHMPLIRNNLVAAFSAIEFEEVQTTEGKEMMRETALEEIQAILTEEIGEPGLEQVLFTNFVIQ
ncbi:MAG: flagellar basal body-associated FliL family protein [Pseudomonadales bacterium]|nr:flagellar basal body-associated FliL family protein [Pseudomonadales bacterium]